MAVEEISVHPDQLRSHANRGYGSGASDSINLAAWFSLLLPILVGGVIFFWPPVFNFVNLTLITDNSLTGTSGFEIHLKNLRAKTLQNIDIELNTNADLIDITKMDALRTLSGEANFELFRKTNSGFQDTSIIRIKHLPGLSTFIVQFNVNEPSSDLQVISVSGNSVAEVGGGLFSSLLVTPNVLYLIALVAAVVMLFYLTWNYYKRAYMADFLNSVLSNTLELLSKKEIAAEGGVETPEDFLLKAYDLWTSKNKKRFKFISGPMTNFFKYTRQNDMHWKRADATDSSPSLFCIGPFHLTGQPTFRRYFSENRVLILSLDANELIIGHGWLKTEEMLSSKGVKIFPW